MSTCDMEISVENLTKRMRRQERMVKMTRIELDKMKEALEKKKNVEKFMETMTSGSCVICSDSFIAGIESGDRSLGFTTYKCRCSTARFVHIGCFTRSFKCACGSDASIKSKSASGRDVSVVVSERRDIIREIDLEVENNGISAFDLMSSDDDSIPSGSDTEYEPSVGGDREEDDLDGMM